MQFLKHYGTILMSLLEKVEAAVDTAASAQDRYLKEVHELKTLLSSKSSAPKEQVYPKFAVLASTYTAILEESRLGADKISLFEMMTQRYQTFEFSLTEE